MESIEARNVLRALLPLMLLLFILAGCGGESMEGRSATGKGHNSSGDRENKETSAVLRMSLGTWWGRCSSSAWVARSPTTTSRRWCESGISAV